MGLNQQLVSYNCLLVAAAFKRIERRFSNFEQSRPRATKILMVLSVGMLVNSKATSNANVKLNFSVNIAISEFLDKSQGIVN